MRVYAVLLLRNVGLVRGEPIGQRLVEVGAATLLGFPHAGWERALWVEGGVVLRRLAEHSCLVLSACLFLA